MNKEATIREFIEFIQSLFRQDQIAIRNFGEKFTTVDIDCLKNREKILTLFITPEDISLAETFKVANPEDSFAPFDKQINDFNEAKKVLEKVRKEGILTG